MAEPRPEAPFARASAQVRETVFRDDVLVREIDPPQGLAPYSLALAADIRPDAEGDSVYGTGRFVLLHDPEEPSAWGGAWRIVCFAQAPLEPEIGRDPLLADVAWSWLVDSLDSGGAHYTAASGTATKIVSKGFGSLSHEGEGAQIELRASWSPVGDIAPHVTAWAESLCMLGGLPPGSEGIASLSARRAERG